MSRSGRRGTSRVKRRREWGAGRHGCRFPPLRGHEETTVTSLVLAAESHARRNGKSVLMSRAYPIFWQGFRKLHFALKPVAILEDRRSLLRKYGFEWSERYT